MKHCGKTTLGKALSHTWDCSFFDVDELIENAFRAEECRGMTVREILAHYGENGFRKREERAVVDLFEKIKKSDSERLRKGETINNYVVALGGRIPLNPRLQPILKKMGLNIFLELDAEEAWQRVARSGMPSFLKSNNPKKGFRAADMTGKEHNDQMSSDGFATNNAGGVLGGISTGDEILFRVAVKPTSSISLTQKTVDLRGHEREIRTEGRHDPCICPRIVPVVEAMAGLVLEDHIKRQSALHS